MHPDRTDRKSTTVILVLCGVAIAAVYAALTATFPLTRYGTRVRLYDWLTITGRSLGGIALYTAAIVSLFLLYWRAWRSLENAPQSARLPWLLIVVIAFAAVFALVLIWMYPISATDLFAYFFRSRIWTLYGGDPFVDVPRRFYTDPYLYTISGWLYMGSPYGPLWEWLAAGVALLVSGRLVPNLVALKGVAALFYVGSVLLVYAILKHIAPERRASGTVLFAWNPLLLLEWVGNGHNDAVMVFFILLGVWLWVRHHHLWVLPALVVAALVKAVAVIVIPFFLIATWLQESSPRKRLRSIALAFVLSLAIAWVLSAPFTLTWGNVGIPWNEAATKSAYSFSSTLMLALHRWVVTPLARSPFLTEEALSTLVRYVDVAPHWLATGGLAILYLRQLVLVWRRRRGPIAASAEAFFACLVLAPNYRMWYPAWAMTLATLCPERDRLLRAGAACLTAELSALIYTYLFKWDILIRYAMGTTFTLLLPVLSPALYRLYGRVRRRRNVGGFDGGSPADSRQTG
jgi:hypothetical protein